MSSSHAHPDAPSPPRPRGAVVERRIQMDASADVIWEVLADVKGWGGWNPIHPEASGSIEMGDRIMLTIALPGMKPQKSSATVFHSLPGEALQFGTPAFAGPVHATRYIEILPSTPGSCTVVNGEIFGRLLGPALVRMVGARIDDGLRMQNEGLKAVAEAMWQARCRNGLRT